MKTVTIERVSDLCKELELAAPKDFVLVDINGQTLSYGKGTDAEVVFKVSTSQFGTGNREGSYKTPRGLHRVAEKIGGDAPPWTIFSSRENTGIVWTDGMEGENRILTRILRLQGVEAGVNAGPSIDSYDRYIYIHGTNREDLIGTPFSHGCVCMRNEDIIALYDMVEAGTYVYIDG
ncbi:MAG: L,D-transpeptidase [Chitinispirillales bacterium]|jgi:lipoprotein-anchoring transpeptidase ErfK/SrfK|nr:L,D-transpeptidase [Chitinispirillales bacterium]